MPPATHRHARIDAVCRELVRRLAWTFNRRDPQALASVLAPEVVWEMPDNRRLHCPTLVCRGYDELWSRSGFDDLWLDLDAARTSWIEVESEHRARGSTWVVLYRAASARNRAGIATGQAELIGCCRHVFARTRCGWRISEHRSTRLWRSASAAALPARPAALPLFT